VVDLGKCQLSGPEGPSSIAADRRPRFRPKRSVASSSPRATPMLLSSFVVLTRVSFNAFFIEHANPHLCIWQLSLGLSSVKRCETPCGSESNLSLVLPDLTIFTQTLFSSMILRSNINWPLAVINRGMDNRNRAHQTTC